MRPPEFPTACPLRYQFWILVRRLRVGILTTRSARGVLTSRQIQTCNSKNDVGRVLRFLVSVDCLWVRDIVLDPNVCVAYADDHREQFLSVSGEAQVRHCPAMLRQLWTPVALRTFPNGPSDPLLRILEVHIDSAIFQIGARCHDLDRADFADDVRNAHSPAPKLDMRTPVRNPHPDSMAPWSRRVSSEDRSEGHRMGHTVQQETECTRHVGLVQP